MAPATITLQPITRENFDAVFQLRIAEDQKTFVEANMVSIAEAYVRPTFYPLAVYADDDLIGFTMYGYDDPPGQWTILQFMIDLRHQRQGHGRRAMQALIPLMIERHSMEEIVLTHSDGNTVAASLYRGLGFVEDGHDADGACIMRLSVESWSKQSPQ